MAIQALSSEEVLVRMRELASRASAIQSRIDASGVFQGASIGLSSIEVLRGSRDGERLVFEDVLKDAVRGVSAAQNAAQTKAQAYQLGDDTVSLEEVMISMQKASLALQGMVQVRNRLVEAYREVMNMQV